ncbi:hypothetical protein SAMN05444362_1032 [Dysgonomonas macrotermitis]|uniref:Uncharacterized protein n=1 Tax=Dysgonomonas macrotermitis TaxID=1346286 RepID=A0A1M4XVM4_9BACT|nr:hypothetical protein SAMN05444362_1032 [Dysgonomonas macrotermitis]
MAFHKFIVISICKYKKLNIIKQQGNTNNLKKVVMFKHIFNIKILIIQFSLLPFSIQQRN